MGDKPQRPYPHHRTRIDLQSAQDAWRVLTTQSHDTTCRAFVFEGGDYRGGCTVNITLNDTINHR